MSAPHWLIYDVIIDGEIVAELDFDVDLDNAVEIFEEINKSLVKNELWEHRLLFRFSEHLYSSTTADFSLEKFFYNCKHSTLVLKLSKCVDFG